jgi:hypothetical protein
MLEVEDQIVYQALINVVAEKLYPKIRGRYYQTVFGHIYAGKKNIWFYEKWSHGYHLFNKEIKKAIKTGYMYAAHFDLTACYDSIDHKVIKHFIEECGLTVEFADFLLNALEKWTADQKHIYHGHGIPQGPLSSGLLSELVLQYFDRGSPLRKTVRYMRYVDDIRLYARNEIDLRWGLLSLDYSSKTLGFFPQGSKIKIHKIASIKDELKSISDPPEIGFSEVEVSPKIAFSRIRALSPKYVIEEETRFKFALSNSPPSRLIARRLMKILDNHPHLYGAILRYFKKFKRLHPAISKELLKRLKDGEPYYSYKAAIFDAALNRVSQEWKSKFADVALGLWKNVKSLHSAADLKAEIIKWLLTENRLKYAELQELFGSQKHEPWVRAICISYLDSQHIGQPSYQMLVNLLLRSLETDPALCGVTTLLNNGLKYEHSNKEAHFLAKVALVKAGLLSQRKRGSPPSYVGRMLIELTGKKLPDFRWRRALGTQHETFQAQLALTISYARSDITACVNALDAVQDRLLFILAAQDGTIGTYNLGQLGSFIGQPKSKFALKYPKFYKACVVLHELRKVTILSHPINRRTKRKTGKITHSDFKKAKPHIHVSLPGFSVHLKLESLSVTFWFQTLPQTALAS